MPELPDITIYLEALERKLIGRPLQGVRLASPFVLRTVEPRPKELVGRTVRGFRRIGKRIVFDFSGDRGAGAPPGSSAKRESDGDEIFLVVHLMIAGRFHWKDAAGAKIPGKIGLAALDFENGTLLFTEASTKKRASLHVVRGEASLEEFSRGGIEPMEATLAQFKDALTCENHTLKRSLTDPTLFSGIGNAYSDEILHRAKLSPVKLTQKMTDEEISTLYRATKQVLAEWTERLRKELGDGFPEKVTAFRPEMAVHGRYKLPCPVCGSPVQRIVHAENESNYCATCQTGGKLLADRALSKLLHGDWPKSLEEMDEKKAEAKKRLTPPAT